MESEAGTIQFKCKCGMQVRARFDQGGKMYKCPGCGAAIRVPEVGVRQGKDEGSPHATQFAKLLNGDLLTAPATFRHLLIYLVGGWLALVVFATILSAFTWYTWIFGILLLLGSTVAFGEQLWRLLRARQRVLVDKDVSLLWGSVRLIAWDPVEGVLFLRNKRLDFSDDDLRDGQGGIRFMYPILGDELALRVPLEVQTLKFADEKVLTREYLSVTIRGTVKWRIVNIKNFYLLVSRVLRSTSDHNDRISVSPLPDKSNSEDPNEQTTIGRLIVASIEWLRLLAEEQTRIVVSRVSSGLLIADRLASEIPEVKSAAVVTGSGLQAEASDWQNATNGLARTIQGSIAAKVSEYGIAIDDVSLQELRLPEEIVQQCIEACKTAYLPIAAKRRATAKNAELAAEVELLGRDVVGTQQIVGSAPAFGLVDFLSQFLNKRLAESSGGIGINPGSAVAAALIAQQATAPAVSANK